jgi:hypothetical protein
MTNLMSGDAIHALTVVLASATLNLGYVVDAERGYVQVPSTR